MSRKTPQQTNILLHMGLWSITTPLLLATAARGLFLLIGAPTTEQNTVTMIAVVLGLLIGVPLGLISFFVTRGIRGWGQHFDQRRAERAAAEDDALTAQVEDQLTAHLTATGQGISPTDPWNGTNPYGCCQNNYDADGNLTHGSPDCQHPLILEQRQSQ